MTGLFDGMRRRECSRAISSCHATEYGWWIALLRIHFESSRPP
ncbi:MAG: hypothetical protein ACLUZZ_00280 [Alistipes inops]